MQNLKGRSKPSIIDKLRANFRDWFTVKQAHLRTGADEANIRKYINKAGEMFEKREVEGVREYRFK